MRLVKGEEGMVACTLLEASLLLLCFHLGRLMSVLPRPERHCARFLQRFII